MDFLNQASAQVADLFRSMTPGARITAGLLLIIVVVAVAYLFNAQVSGPDTDLMNGVPVAANHLQVMKAAFGKAGLNSYEIRIGQIFVPRSQRDLYMAALADAQALPPDIDKVFDDALKNAGAFMPARQREVLLKIAKQKTLGLIISAMRGIEHASVIYDSQVKHGSFRRETITTATASVKPVGNAMLEDEQVSLVVTNDPDVAASINEQCPGSPKREIC